MRTRHTDTAAGSHAGANAPGSARSWRQAAAGVFGAGLGLLPHLLHHVGWLAGTAVVAGLGGTLLFGALGLVAMVPTMLRLRRRFATWWAPGIALAVFTLMFTLSTTLIGPALGGDTAVPAPQ